MSPWASASKILGRSSSDQCGWGSPSRSRMKALVVLPGFRPARTHRTSSGKATSPAATESSSYLARSPSPVRLRTPGAADRFGSGHGRRIRPDDCYKVTRDLERWRSGRARRFNAAGLQSVTRAGGALYERRTADHTLRTTALVNERTSSAATAFTSTPSPPR